MKIHCTYGMVKRRLTRLSIAGVLATSASGQSGTIKDIATLPEISIDAFQNTYLPGTVGYDHGFKLGGIGSGVWKGPGDGPGIFWMTTDRGPNPQTAAPIKRAFPIPTFTPFLLKVKAADGVISILEALPLTGRNGVGVSGLPNDPSAASPASPNALRDEQPFNCDISATIPGNPDGHDIEDLVQDVKGDFWTVDEYGPSISKIDATGRVLKRFVPEGREFVSGVNFSVVGNLPQILSRRPRNRGFEGVAIMPNNKTLMAVVQSPLTNPSAAIGNASRVIRIIAFDIETESVTGEYVYVMQPVTDFGNTNPTEMKISGIAALDEHRLLVLERTDAIAKIYRVDLRNATNILETKWDLNETTPSLESLASFALTGSTNTLANNEVQELEKELVLDLSTLGSVIPPKIEGLTILNGRTIVVSNDNDFQVGAPTCADNVPVVPAQSRLFTIELDQPLK
jgi:hypothetical protein